MADSIVFRMFEHACAFIDCAEYCEVEPNNIQYRTKSHSVSSVVNSAFACEVFLKTLLVFRGIPTKELRGHDLKKLWQKVRKIDIETALSVERAMQEWFKSQNQELFCKLLGDSSNAFNYWRYIYEKSSGKINPQFLRGFRYALRSTCCKDLYNKSWEEYVKSYE